MRLPARWVAIGVFILASGLNYLDRQLLAALEPLIRAEFHLSYQQYGWVLSAFSIIYAVGASAFGLLIDRIGLNLGATAAVGLWSMATVTMGWVGGLGSLLGCRALLGFAQGGGIPANGKAFATYLEPRERAMGTASTQLGISLGSIIAPVWASYAAAEYGWRAAFQLTGLIGLLWIPAWWMVARRTPVQPVPAGARTPAVGELLRRRAYWGLLIATALSMTTYSLWTNWTTSFLTKVWSLPQATVNQQLAWIPPLVASVGALFGGSMSMQLARRGMEVARARRLASLAGAALLFLATAATPFAPTPLTAAIGIGFSYFGATFLSVNLYALPLDLFGTARAGFAVASLTFAYGIMQAVVSPLIGGVVDQYGFTPVCLAAALLPAIAVAVLYGTAE